MDLRAGQVGDEGILREHIEQSKSFDGTLAAYCRQHNLDYDKFMYARGKRTSAVGAKPAGFAMVKPTVVAAETPREPVVKAKIYPQLPDPKWLAELIHNLVSAR